MRYSSVSGDKKANRVQNLFACFFHGCFSFLCESGFDFGARSADVVSVQVGCEEKFGIKFDEVGDNFAVLDDGSGRTVDDGSENGGLIFEFDCHGCFS